MPGGDASTIQLLIQGGAVGLALVVIVGVYLLIRRGMELVNVFVTNHIAHQTAAIDRQTTAIAKNTKVLRKLDESVNQLNRRL